MSTDFNKQIKLAYLTNTIIFVLVLLMMGIYHIIGAKFLVFYSIGVSFFYVLNYVFIFFKKLRLQVWVTYLMLTIYMAVCTIALGYNYGFTLYSMSTIPLIFFIRYLAVKLNMKDPKPVFWTVVIIASCLGSSVYSVIKGPIYTVEGAASFIFLGINTFSVCFFLFFYSSLVINMIINSEKKLEDQANHDALTGLANRYSMRKILNKSVEDKNEKAWIAMIDIDKFKNVNDTYGHAIGDEVIKNLSYKMNDICHDCQIARWGGEEFLIHGTSDKTNPSIIEELRKEIENSVLNIDEFNVKYTISCGVTCFNPDFTMDKWIIDSDNKLYKAKEQGRNRVIF